MRPVVRGSYGVMQGNPDNTFTIACWNIYLALRQTYFLLPSGNLARVDLREEWSEIGLVPTRWRRSGGQTGAHLLKTTKEPGCAVCRLKHQNVTFTHLLLLEPESSFLEPHFVPTAPSVTSLREHNGHKPENARGHFDEEAIREHSENHLGEPIKNVTAADQVASSILDSTIIVSRRWEIKFNPHCFNNRAVI